MKDKSVEAINSSQCEIKKGTFQEPRADSAVDALDP